MPDPYAGAAPTGPGEATHTGFLTSQQEKDLLENYILKPIDDAKKDRDSSGFDQYQKEWLKRFEALRSVSSLERDIKSWPWKYASNIGIPIDATATFAMLARIMRAEFGQFPYFIAKGVGPSDVASEQAMSDYGNWLTIEKMKILIDKYMLYLDALIRGDVIVKTMYEERVVEFEEDTFYYVNQMGEPLRNQIDNLPLEIPENSPPKANPVSGEVYIPTPSKATRQTVIYQGPRLVAPPLTQFIVPREADHPDVNQLDWIAHEYWKPLSYFMQKAKEGLLSKEKLEKMIKTKDELKARPVQGQIQATLGITPPERTKRFAVYEWHGTFEDEDGKPSEIIALVEPKEKTLLGYIKNEFYMKTGRRQFVHYQPFPRLGSFYSSGVPQMIRGIRNTLDAMINQGIDRGSLFNNPPILYDRDNSGFDPSVHKFGPGRSWGLDDINLLKPFEMKVSEQQALIREEQLFMLAQKLLGIDDISLGSRASAGIAASNAGNRTATGLTLISQEANIRFDLIIKLFQEHANPELMFQIIRHVSLNMDKEQQEVFRVTEGEDPFRQISGEEMGRNYNFYFLGNISTINQSKIAQDAISLYQLYVQGQNPLVVGDPEMLQKISQKPIDALGYKDIKLKSPQELQQIQLGQRIQQLQQMRSMGIDPVQLMQAQMTQQGQRTGNGRPTP